jgi:hypothetical protein
MHHLKDHFNKSPWQMGWLWHHLHDYDDRKTESTQMHKMYEQKNELYDVPTCYMKFLKYDPSQH